MSRYDGLNCVIEVTTKGNSKIVKLKLVHCIDDPELHYTEVNLPNRFGLNVSNVYFHSQILANSVFLRINQPTSYAFDSYADRNNFLDNLRKALALMNGPASRFANKDADVD